MLYEKQSGAKWNKKKPQPSWIPKQRNFPPNFSQNIFLGKTIQVEVLFE